MKKIDVEGLKKLLNYLNTKDKETIANEIAKLTVDEYGWVNIGDYSFSILEEVKK